MTTNEDQCQLRDIVKERWVVREKIGSGGYGQIYRVDHRLGLLEDMAMKVSAGDPEIAQAALKVEAHILRQLKGHKHFCHIYEYGNHVKFHYIVMSSCSKTLSELRRGTSEGSFSISTAFRLGVQILKSIDDIHEIGFIHRDIKPSNFMMGKGKNAKVLYMLDFGLARKYTTSTNLIKPPRQYAGFRGTVRYASPATHANQDMGRKDDLWSMFYVMVEFLRGQLPWSQLRDKDEIGRIKQEITVDGLTEKMDEVVRLALRDFHEHIQTLQYESKPDYITLKNCLTHVLTVKKCQLEDNYDWEETIFNFDKIVQKFKNLGKSTGMSTKFSKSHQHLSEKVEFNDGEDWNDVKRVDNTLFTSTTSPTSHLQTQMTQSATVSQPQQSQHQPPSVTQSSQEALAVHSQKLSLSKSYENQPDGKSLNSQSQRSER